MHDHHLRYWAHLTDAPVGLAGLTYCSQLLSMRVPLRLAPIGVAYLGADTSGRLDNPWSPYASLLLTMMPGKTVNVVCGHGEDLVRLRTTGMENWACLTPGNLGERDLLAALDGYHGVYAFSDELARDAFAKLGLVPRQITVTA